MAIKLADDSKNNITIAVDFDGTCVTHEYPKIGSEIDGAVDTMQELIRNKRQIILLTMRDGKELKEAISWCFDRDIYLRSVNRNPKQKAWTTSPKVYAHAYIDDAAIGCPLIYDPKVCKRPYVDWKVIKELLITKGLL